MVTTVCHQRGRRPRSRSARNAALRGPGHRRPAHARTAAALRGALGGPATSAGGMTGPNLATRVGAAITRRKPASAPPDAPSPDTAPAEDSAPAHGAGPTQDAIPAQDAGPAPQTAEPAQPSATPPPTAAVPSRPSPAVLRRHWLFAVLLTAGLVLRVLAMVAYHPALIYVDTLKYLYGASPGSEPFGYTVALKIVLAAGDLGTVAALQHLLGLAMAVTLYVVLLRRGIPRWAAALTTAPVLLDAYQVQMEHTIMPDVLFEALVLAGLAVLLWRPVVTPGFAAVGGLILAASATVMQLGVILVVPAVIYVLAAGGGWRRAVTSSGALVIAFAAVIFGYCGASYIHDGHFWLARRQSLTGRLAASADCATLQMSAAAKAVCPTPAQQTLGPDWLEHSGQSPLANAVTNPLPPGAKRGAAIAELNAAVMGQQPLRVAGSVLRDAVRLFALTREQTAGVTPIGRWQFQDGYPEYPPWVSVCPPGPYNPATCMTAQQAVQKRVAPVTDLLVRPGGPIVIGVQRKLFGAFHAHTLKSSYGGQAQVDRPIARFLRSYQLDGGYTPGPLLALCFLAGLAGSLVLLRQRLPARTRQLGLACLLFTGAAVFALLAPDVYQFSWRYELPAVVTLVPAGVLGVATVASLRGAGRSRVRTERSGQE
jgi:hypothetical protein